MSTGRKVHWLLLFAVGAMAVLLPRAAFAQAEKIDLILRLVSGGYYNTIAPGESKTVFLELENGGNKAITGIRLSADKPEGWVVEFKPDSIAYLGAGSAQTIDVIITPASDAGRREYTVTMIAQASETKRVTSTMVRIEAAISFWLWVGIAVAVLVAAGFVMIFLRSGR